MGIFKRCMRLFQWLVDDFEIHLVNYGPFPDSDSMFDQLRSKIAIHSPSEDTLASSLTALIQQLDPKVVVFGEAPLRGNMWISNCVTTRLSIPQVCIENYYGAFVETYMPSEWPSIDRWLLLGLLPGGQWSLRTERVVVAPPLLSFPTRSGPRDRICVFGYDEVTLVTAITLLESWPHERVDYFIAPEWSGRIRPSPGSRVFTLPPDGIISDSLARAELVIGKAGFQQIVEAVCLGAPILCRKCGGGVTAELIPNYLRPFVRFIEDDSELPALLGQLPEWLAKLPPNPWQAIGAEVSNSTRYAAEILKQLFTGSFGEKTEPEPISCEGNSWPFGFRSGRLYEVLQLVHRKRWTRLGVALDAIKVSVQGDQVPTSRVLQQLSERFDAAGDFKILPVSRVSPDAYRCCLMTMNADSWTVQEVEFVIALGFKQNETTLTSIGITLL